MHGLKVKAQAKKVPDVIFRCPSPVRAAFLAVLFIRTVAGTKTKRRWRCLHHVGVSTTVGRRPAPLSARRFVRPANRTADSRLGRERLEEPAITVAGREVLRGKVDFVSGWDGCPARRCIKLLPRPYRFVRSVAKPASKRPPFDTSSPSSNPVPRPRPAWYWATCGTTASLPLSAFATSNSTACSVAEHHNLVANGVVVKNCYEEQVMCILNRLGGIELSSAYACIKAISKKKYEIIDQRRADFLRGRSGTRREQGDGRGDFRTDRVFGGYGFNKAHSAAYAQIGYQTAYLKANYTPEFMAALLTSEIEDGKQARREGRTHRRRPPLGR